MAKMVEERHEGTRPAWTGGEEETWTDSFGAGCTQLTRATNTLSYGEPPGWGDWCKRITYDAAGWDATKTLDFGSITGACYCHFEAVIVEENIANTENQPILRLRDSTVPETIWQLAIYQDAGGDLLWRASSMRAGTGNGTTNTQGPEITLDTVYIHDVMYDFDNARILWYVDGVLIEEVTGITPGELIDRVRIGLAAGSENEKLRFHYDRLLIDDAAWPEYHVPHIESNRSLLIAGAEVGELIDANSQPNIDLVMGGDPDALNVALRDQENRVTDSEDLDDTSYWTKTRVNVPVVADGPNGSSQVAWTIAEDATVAATHILTQASIPMMKTRLYAATCWVADLQQLGVAPRVRNFEIIIQQEGGETIYAKFDLQTGVVNSSGDTGDGNLLGAKIVASSGDWHKVMVWGKFDGGSANSVTWVISLLSSGFSRAYNGDDTSGVRIWNPIFSRGGPTHVRSEITTGETPYYFGPGDRADVDYTLTWTEKDGAPWGEQQMFTGKVIGAKVRTIARGDDSKVNYYEIECAGPAAELGEQRFDLTIDDDTADVALDAVIALRSGDGFTAAHDSAIGSIAGDTFIYASPVAMVEEIARRAGRAFRVHPNKEVELFVPGTVLAVPTVDRDAVTGQLPYEPEANWSRDSRKIAGSVRVKGDTAMVIATGGSYTDIDAPVLNASGVSDATDLARIATSLLNGLKQSVLNGTIPTWRHDITPGWKLSVSDLDWGISEEEVYARRVTMQRHGPVWVSSLQVTTEELIDYLGIMPPLPDDPKSGDPLPGITDYYVMGAIPTPNQAAPACGAGEVRLHLRFDTATDTWRMEMHCGSGVGGSGADYWMWMHFLHQATMTVTEGEDDVESEAALLVGDGTTDVVVGTSTDPPVRWSPWEANVSGKDVMTAIPDTLKGTLRAEVIVNPWAGTLTSITVGDLTVASNAPAGVKIRIHLPVDPTIGDAHIGTLNLSALAGDLDDISDGSTYKRVTGVSAGHQIQAASIATDAVTNVKINTGAVDTAELAADAVTGAKIEDDAVAIEHIANNAVDTAQLAADAVTGAKIEDDAVDTEHIATSAVTIDQVAPDAVDSNELVDGAVIGDKINTNAVGGSKFKESVINEFQSVEMGSELIDSEWDALET